MPAGRRCMGGVRVAEALRRSSRGRAHTFRVRGTDAAGNLEPAPASYSWTVDLTPPETTITSGPSGLSRTDSASFSFSSSEPGSFECNLDGAGFAGCSSPRTYTGLSDGDHTFDVRAIESGGERGRDTGSPQLERPRGTEHCALREP